MPGSVDGRRIRHHGSFATYFYNKKEEQALEAIKHLNGKHLGGFKQGLKLTYRGLQDVNAVHKQFRKGTAKRHEKNRRDLSQSLSKMNLHGDE